jgi:hypothetical protein
MANRIFYNPEGFVEVVIEGEQSYMFFANLGSTGLDIIDDFQKKANSGRV